MKATKSTRKVRSKKSEYVSDETFADLKEALEGALAYERAEHLDLRVTRVQGSRPAKASSKIAIHQSETNPRRRAGALKTLRRCNRSD